MADIHIIPVAGVTELPDVASLPDETEARRDQRELLLLKSVTGLAVILVCCAWVLLALD